MRQSPHRGFNEGYTQPQLGIWPTKERELRKRKPLPAASPLLCHNDQRLWRPSSAELGACLPVELKLLLLPVPPQPAASCLQVETRAQWTT